MSQGPVIFSAPGITVKIPSTAQLLAMKLCAWRDDVDIEDARRLLLELTGDREKVWQAIAPHLVPGNELKAHYAFLDLWESTYGKN
jgi:predicted nucleotidyltransferase